MGNEQACSPQASRRPASHTKQFEKIHRGPLSELCAAFKDATVRGETTAVIAGNHPKFLAEDTDASEVFRTFSYQVVSFGWDEDANKPARVIRK